MGRGEVPAANAAPLRLDGDGVTLAADAFGDAADPPVLLLHGSGQTRHSWDDAGPVLAARGWYAVAIDLRGHGDSDWAADGRYGPEHIAADVRVVARQFSWPPVIVGASAGGNAALIAIGESDEPPACGLVLVDVAPRMERDGVQRVLGFMSERPDGFESIEEAADVIASYMPNRKRPQDLSGLAKNLRERNGRFVWHWDPRMVKFGAARMEAGMFPVIAARLAEAARRIVVPTLVVRGGQSEIVSEDSVQHLRELIPTAEVVDIGSAGHMVAGDRNERFTGAIVDFLERRIRPPTATCTDGT